MLQSTIHQDDPLKVLNILSKTPLTKENKCQMLTQAINFCKLIFFLRE